MSLYAGLTQREICAITGLPLGTVNRYISECRVKLTEKFVPLHVGHYSREEIRKNTTEMSKVLNNIQPHDDTIATIWDGTYIYLNKSSHFRFQRVSYSGHKKKNYLKPMVAVTTNGKIVDIFGPERLWAGSTSDADILDYILKLPFFDNLFKQNDIFLLDRGFERVKPTLEEKGYQVSIPCLRKDNNQLTTLEANRS